MEWIEKDIIFDKLKHKSKTFFDNLGDKVCISKDYNYCLLLQINDTWFIENEGWRDSNSKPKEDRKGRLILNFFCIDDESENWFKIFTPLKFKNYRLKTIDENNYQILTDNGFINGGFKNFDSLMWDLMTGKAESEIEIENKFKLIEQK